MKKRKLTAIIFGILALGWVGVLFYFSGQNGSDSTSISMRVAQLLVKWFPGIGMTAEAFNPILRKIAHFAIFAAEGFFTGMSLMLALPVKTGMACATGACILMAAANEYHQTFIEGRAGQARDVLIDSAGAVAGIFCAAIIIALFSIIFSRQNTKQHQYTGTGD